jgi:PncC family amidohydrolase
MIAAALTDVPGSSEVFVGGMVTYSNGMKSSALRVPASLLEEYGAVSRETAEAMARGAREATGADWTVSTTGVAGPGGGSEEKPVGTVWIAAEGPTGTFSVCRRFPGDRMAVRIKATAAALDLLRLSIVGIPL